MQTPNGWNVCLWRLTDPETLWMAEQALDLLQPDRWLNYHWWPQVNHPGYVPMLWGYPLTPDDIASIQRRMRQYPDGETWIFVNEGNMVEQANITPAKAVELVYQFNNIGYASGSSYNTCGPNAAINMPAQAVGRLSGAQWMREFYRKMRQKDLVSLSMHGIHLYNSTDRGMVASIWNRVRHEWRYGWLGALPIIVTEFCAENEPVAKQIEVMDEVFRLYQIGRAQGPAGVDGVMGAFWFAAFDPIDYWPNSALCEIDPGRTRTMRLTPLGQHWKELQARL